MDDGTSAITASASPDYLHPVHAGNAEPAPGPLSDLARVLLLFRAGLPPVQGFMVDQYEIAAENLGVSPHAIAAIAAVQSRKPPPDSFVWTARLYAQSALEFRVRLSS